MLYSIEVFGNSAEVGIEKLTKAQFNFWTNDKNKPFLKDALSEDYSFFEGEILDEYCFKTSYHGLCNLAQIFGGRGGGLFIEIAPIEETVKNHQNYSYVGELNNFFNELTPIQMQKIIHREIFKFPRKTAKTEGFLIWKAEEDGFSQYIEVEVGESFNLQKLKFNFISINGDDFLECVSYDGYSFEANENLIQSGYLEVEIISA